MNCLEQLIKTTRLNDYVLTKDYDPIHGINVESIIESAFMDNDTSNHVLTLLEVLALLNGESSNAMLSEIHELPTDDKASVLQVLNQFWNPKQVEEDL